MKKRILSLVLCAAMLLSMCLFLGAGVAEDTSDTPAESTEAAQVQAPQTVVYTAAGPFLPAVSVQPVLRAARASGAGEFKDGLNLSKTATANEDGSYTIRMEAFTTGKVTTTTSTTPVDVVLVLDQSGSMAYDFNGNSTNNDTSRRQYAMKQAVNQFIGAVADKYDAEKSDHRISIVTFGSDASVLQGWTPVSQDGKMTLQGEITGLPDTPSGATNVGDGMKQAETLMGSGYNYTGSNTTRQKVVVVFTDGVPTTQSDFSTNVANTAIQSAKALKDSGATVYSVGIFNGANPDEMYGASGFDTNSNGTVNSKWVKDTWGLFPGTDFPEADRPAGNRFLNLLSSNFEDAAEVGLKRETKGLGILYYKITYTIARNFNRTSSSYYLTANDSASLSRIFTTISENIGQASIDLSSSTVVKDIVTPYFTMPANTADVKFTPPIITARALAWSSRPAATCGRRLTQIRTR
ncbi:MAG: vWA domain-containing protein [Oscillospiraceae bacterium]